jgi:hypothetical protein
LPGHTEHITPPTATMGQTTASKPGPGPAAGASGAKAPSQLGFKQQRGSQGSGRGGGLVPELRVLAVEVHADSRGSLLPDPRWDWLYINTCPTAVHISGTTSTMYTCCQLFSSVAPGQEKRGCVSALMLSKLSGSSPALACMRSCALTHPLILSDAAGPCATTQLVVWVFLMVGCVNVQVRLCAGHCSGVHAAPTSHTASMQQQWQQQHHRTQAQQQQQS